MDEEKLDIGKLIAEGLEEMVENLKNNIPIEAVEITRVETPDGPMHIKKPIIIERENNGENIKN